MYPPTSRTTANRDRGRISYDRAAAHAILDEAYHCALGFTVDGEPRILPTLHVRLDDTLYLHGSTGSRPLLAARGPDGLRVCVSVTLLDGLVYGRSQFHHSANYRSLVAHGIAGLVTGRDEKTRVLTALVEKLGTGRSTESRPPTAKELAETARPRPAAARGVGAHPQRWRPGRTRGPGAAALGRRRAAAHRPRPPRAGPGGHRADPGVPAAGLSRTARPPDTKSPPSIRWSSTQLNLRNCVDSPPPQVR